MLPFPLVAVGGNCQPPPALLRVFNFSILNLFLTEMSVCLKGVVMTSEMKIIQQKSKLGKDLMGPC